MPTAWDVYAQELLPLGYGYPLWDPAPDPHTGEIEIGDVGFVENGQFVRLFNPTLPREHPVNRVWGLPKDFRQLDIADRLIFDKELTFSSDSLCSRHVTKAEVNAKLDVDSAVDVALKYNTASSSGAVLYLPTKCARRREVLRDSTIMHDYLQKNYKAWHHHLHHHNDLKVSKKDLLFVRGYIKTARWAVAAFADSSREEGATVGGGHGPAKTSFSVDLSRQEALGGWTNVGLKRKEYRPDQCVFVQFLQYTTRDAFHQWVLKRKRSVENVLHISPTKQACETERQVVDDESSVHVDKKRRIIGPGYNEDESDVALSLTNELACRVFQKGDEDQAGAAVIDSEDPVTSQPREDVVFERIADDVYIHDMQVHGRDMQEAEDTAAANNVFDVKDLSIKPEVPAIVGTEYTKKDGIPGRMEEAKADSRLEVLMRNTGASASADEPVPRTPPVVKLKQASSTPPSSTVSEGHGSICTNGKVVLIDGGIVQKRREV